MSRTWVWVAGTVVALLCSSASVWAQRSDRAIISGVVTDEQGSAVPGATVTIRNEATGVDTVLITNDAGAYTSQPLVLGTYTVKVELTGFRTSQSGNILLQGGEQVRHDDGMQDGELTETVEVTGRSGIDVTTPDVAHSVDE